MSLAPLQKEIRRFLSTPDKETICISGAWGVGKTYAWTHFLAEARRQKEICLPRYSYVSLFGINSLDEFKYSIFENSIDSANAGEEPNLGTLRSNIGTLSKPFGRKSLRLLQRLPFVKKYVGDLGPAWFLTVWKTIVCVDDMERKGRGLALRDVLGLISSLKEHRECKVVLILNDGALEEVEAFRTYFEKVVDANLRFAPSPQECVDIALNRITAVEKLLASNCVTLGVSNIRVIKKIERSARQIEPLLNGLDPSVLEQAVNSLVLLGWSLYEPGIAPSTDYLLNRQLNLLSKKEDDLSPKEAAWSALLDVYGFSNADEFDLALLEGLRQGFFDPSSIEPLASALNAKASKTRLTRSFEEAWRVLHDSFNPNEDLFIARIAASFRDSIQVLSPMDVNGTVGALKALGRTQEATVLLDEYVSSHASDKKLFDLSHYVFAHHIDDPDVIQAFSAKLATFKEERRPIEILRRVGDPRGWRSEDLNFLAEVSSDEYYRIFKENEGQDLHSLIYACLQFDRISNASEAMRQISQRAKEALARIGQESPLNALRVRNYGV